VDIGNIEAPKKKMKPATYFAVKEPNSRQENRRKRDMEKRFRGKNNYNTKTPHF